MNFKLSHSRVRSAVSLAALLGTASFVALIQGGAAQAQDQSQTRPLKQQLTQAQRQQIMRAQGGAQVAQADDVPETVLITGSLISGTASVGVPVSNLVPQDFAETGALAINDILKSVPALDIDAEASPTYGGGTLSFLQNVQIHSLGTGSGVETLLLINGLRFPPQNYSNDTVNPAIIPTIALERIDILSAGASAVYGSDATAGVINLILKRGYDGAMTQGGFTAATRGGYAQWQASQLFGRSWETGNVTASYSITDSNAMQTTDRDFYTQDFGRWGLMNLIPRGASLPGLAHSGNATSVPPPGLTTLPAGETANAGTLFCGNCFSIPKGQNGVGLTWAAIMANPGTAQNQVNNWAYAHARPRLQSNQATIVFDQRLTNDFYGLGSISLFAEAIYSNQRGKQVYPSGNGEARASLQTNLPVPTTNPFYPTGTRCTTNPSATAPAGTPAACTPTNITVDYSFAAEVPVIINGGETAVHWAAGLNFDNLPFDWNGKATFSMTDDKNFGDATNDINANNLRAALGNTIAASGGGSSYTKPAAIPYLNVFCDPTAFTCNDPKTLQYIVGYRLQHERFKITETAFNFNGPVFDLPGGTLEAAIAAQTLSFHWTYQQLQNNNTQSTSIITNTLSAASQQSHAIFGQVNIPVFGEDFTLPGVENFIIEVGYRYDSYNNLKDPVWTPKVAANWLVGGGLTMRGAWGKSFRVPSFAENDPNGSRVAGVNPLGLFANQTDVSILGCNAVAGSPAGVAIPGSLTAALNPTCSANAALRQPGGISVELSGNGAAAILRGHGLSPQTLSQWSLGFHYAPTEPLFGGLDLSGLSADVSWFRLEFKGLIDNNGPAVGPPVPDDPKSRAVYTVIPRPDLPITASENADFYAMVQSLAAVTGRGGFSFDPAAIPNIKFIQDVALTNVGSRAFGGIDFDVRYDLALEKLGLGDMGAINIGAAGYYQVIDRSRATPEEPLDDRYEGRESGNRLQRVRYRLGWANESLNITAFANYFGHQAINIDGANLVPPCFFQPGFGPGSCYQGSQYFGPAGNFPNITPATVYFDLSLGYQTGETPANAYLRNLGFQLSVNDILDTGPPFSVGARGNGAIRAFDNAFSDLGRTVTFTVTKVW